MGPFCALLGRCLHDARASLTPTTIVFPTEGKRKRAAQHIVIGVDGSAASQYAVQWAMDNLVSDGDTVVLLHVSPDYGILKNGVWASPVMQ